MTDDHREEINIKIRCLEPKASLLVEELEINMKTNTQTIDQLIHKALKLKDDLVIKKK